MAKSGISLDWGGLDRRLMEAARGLAVHQAILADIGEALEARFVLEDKLILLVLDAARVKHPA